jgi:hypothetical protein
MVPPRRTAADGGGHLPGGGDERQILRRRDGAIGRTVLPSFWRGFGTSDFATGITLRLVVGQCGARMTYDDGA